MAVRSRRLAGPLVVTGTAAAVTLFTTPADRTDLVKALTIVNATAGSTTVTFYLNSATSGAMVWRATAAVGSTQLLDPWLVLHPGDSLLVHSSGQNVTVAAYGSRLAGPPV